MASWGRKLVGDGNVVDGAARAPQLTWTGRGHRPPLFIEAELLLPELLLLQKAENVNVRVSELTVMLNTLCSPDALARKTSWCCAVSTTYACGGAGTQKWVG